MQIVNTKNKKLTQNSWQKNKKHHHRNDFFKNQKKNKMQYCDKKNSVEGLIMFSVIDKKLMNSMMRLSIIKL